MPTIKPRVQVTLESSTHEVIQRLAALQGRTRGSIIAELLDEVAPALTRTVALLEAAAAAPEQVRAGLRNVVEGVHRDLVAASGDSVGQLDILLSAFSAEGVNPHVVTRGSGTGKTRGSTKANNEEKASRTGHTAPPTDEEYTAAIKSVVRAKKRG
jgi:hypothetical protein